MHRPSSRAALAATLLAALAVAACAPADRPADGGGDSVVAAATADTAADSTPGTTPDTTASTTADSAAVPPLTPDGWGPLRIGMTRAEVVAAAGDDANPDAVGGPEPEVCDEWRPSSAPAGLLVMIEAGRLTRISLGGGSDVRTMHGLRVGDPAAQVRAAVGAGAEETSHKYQAAPAAYVTVWARPPATPTDSAARGLVYELGADGRVSRVHAGGPSIRYVEGCL